MVKNNYIYLSLSAPEDPPRPLLRRREREREAESPAALVGQREREREMLKIQTHFSYQRLRNVGAEHEDKDRLGLIDYGFLRSRSFVRVRKLGSKRRLRLKIPSLKRFLRRRVRAVSGFRVSVAKAVKRLIEGRAHIGDLFAGNYMFMQVSPTPLSLYDKSLVPNRHALQYPPLQKVA